jgi:gliding motility-associated-like protein
MIPVKQNIIVILLFIGSFCQAQNSMVGDGFGGRLWYSPTNYTVGSYSGYSICYDDSSQLYGWGSNASNQLGLGPLVWGINVPTPIPNMTNVKYFSTGYNMGAIKNDSTGWIWGFTTNPIQVITNAYFLDASSYNTSFVKIDGTVWTLGDNSSGQFGDGTNSTPSSSLIVPTQMNNVSNAVRVANNYNSTIILLADSTLVSCGDNFYGNLGLGQSVANTSIPLPISGLPKIIDIKSTAEGTVALAANGDVYSWGIDYNSFNFNYTPILLPNLSNIIAISGCDDGYHFLALDSNKNCYGWGSWNSAMGVPSSTFAGLPILITSNVIDIMAGESFSYIVKSDGSLWASGSSTGGSIWLNLPDTFTEEFIPLDPSLVLGACPIVGDNVPDNTIPPPPISDTIITTNITFPNVFSPNGDGENDEFYFPNEGVSDINWQIYNRWGILIFETNQTNQKWDGKTTSGKECPEGTYYYVLNYKLLDKESERVTGYVTLFR